MKCINSSDEIKIDIECACCGQKRKGGEKDRRRARCGYCEKTLCVKCGKKPGTALMICDDCYKKNRFDLEDVFVGPCPSCGWISIVGCIGCGPQGGIEPCELCKKIPL